MLFRTALSEIPTNIVNGQILISSRIYTFSLGLHGAKYQILQSEEDAKNYLYIKHKQSQINPYLVAKYIIY